MEVSLASPPTLQHIYLKLLVTLIVNLLVVNKKTNMQSITDSSLTFSYNLHLTDIQA